MEPVGKSHHISHPVGLLLPSTHSNPGNPKAKKKVKAVWKLGQHLLMTLIQRRISVNDILPLYASGWIQSSLVSLTFLNEHISLCPCQREWKNMFRSPSANISLNKLGNLLGARFYWSPLTKGHWGGWSAASMSQFITQCFRDRGSLSFPLT